MAYAEVDKVNATEALLKKAGFTVSRIHASRPSCFDVAARKANTLVLIKVQLDISGISPQESWELRLISENIQASSLYISDKVHERPLEDDTVYSRFNVSAVTLKTFRNMILHGLPPLIQAGPGGYYVEIDGEAVKRRREELGLSLGEVAEKVGISRRTLYGYERGITKASVAAAYRLISVLGAPIAKPINVLSKHEEEPEHPKSRHKHVIVRSRLMKRFFRRLLNCSVITVRKAPFDFAVHVPEKEARVIGRYIKAADEDMPTMVEEIVSLSRVVQARPLFVTDSEDNPPVHDVQCIPSDELSRIRRPEELCEF